MNHIKSLLGLLLLLVLESCANSTKTEIYQKKRDVVTNVHSLVTEIQTDPVLIGSIARPCVLGNYVIIADFNSPDRLIHLFRKANSVTFGAAPRLYAASMIRSVLRTVTPLLKIPRARARPRLS